MLKAGLRRSGEELAGREAKKQKLTSPMEKLPPELIAEIGKHVLDNPDRAKANTDDTNFMLTKSIFRNISMGAPKPRIDRPRKFIGGSPEAKTYRENIRRLNRLQGQIFEDAALRYVLPEHTTLGLARDERRDHPVAAADVVEAVGPIYPKIRNEGDRKTFVTSVIGIGNEGAAKDVYDMLERNRTPWSARIQQDIGDLALVMVQQQSDRGEQSELTNADKALIHLELRKNLSADQPGEPSQQATHETVEVVSGRSKNRQKKFFPSNFSFADAIESLQFKRIAADRLDESEHAQLDLRLAVLERIPEAAGIARAALFRSTRSRDHGR